MSRLRLMLACGDYDRHAALIAGAVVPEGIELGVITLEPEEMFFRMMRHQEFDIAELSLSSYAVSLGRGNSPFIALPIYPSRFFRHAGIFVSTRRGIEKPADLIGKRIGTPEYQLTAPVWIRGILADDYGVTAESVEHVTGGIEQPGRIEKAKLDLPAGIRVTAIRPDQTLSRMLADGEIDALVSPRAPSTLFTEPQAVRRLFPDYGAAERDYFRRTGIFPIMHAIVVRRAVYEANRWVAQSLVKAFAAAKRHAMARLGDGPALQTMLPFIVSQAEETRSLMGADWWPYGLEPNRKTLETFLRYHHEQGLSPRRLSPDELFAPESLESFVI